MTPALVALLLSLSPLPMTLQPDDRAMELSATAEAEVTPTQAVVAARLEIVGREPQKTQDSCDAQVKELQQALAALGVDPRDEQVYEGGSGPAYDEDGKASRFAARRQLNVTVRDLKKTAPVLALLTKGKTLVPTAVTFTTDRFDEAQLKALEAAAQRARRKADLLAAQLGFKIVRVYRVSELPGSAPGPVTYAGPSITLPASLPPLKAIAAVNVIFELEGGATARPNS